MPNSRIGRTAVALGSIIFCWGLFVILMHYVWPYLGIVILEELNGTAAYAWIHQIPNMMSLIPRIHIFGIDIPAMLMLYHGPWSIYFLTPFIAIGGCSLATLRFYSAFMFFFALWGTWRLTLLLSGDRITAFLSTFLLAVCPIMVTTHCLNVAEPDIAGSIWALCFAVSFARSRKPIYAYAACAAFFAALCARAYVAGLGVGLLLYASLSWRRLLSLLPQSRWAKARLITGCLGCAVIFLLPIIAYNAGHGWPTLKFFAAHLVQRDPVCAMIPDQACSNLAYWTNLKTSFSQLAMLWDGTPFSVLAREPWHWLYVLPLSLSLFCATEDAWRRRTIWSVPAMLWIVVIGYFLVSPVSPTEQFPIHLAPLTPILCVLALSWISAVVPAGPKRRAALLAMAILCAAQFTGDFHLLRRDNLDFSKAGWYQNAPILIAACRWAQEHSRTPIISLSSSFAVAAPYFTQNQARMIPWPRWNPAYRVPWKRWLRRKDRPYFLIENDGNGLNYADALKTAAKKFGIPLVSAKVFSSASGHPAFEFYRAL